MVKTSEFRPAIIRMLERGKGVREIARDLGISPGTVTKAKQRFQETGSNKDRPKGRPEKTARSQQNIRRVKAMIQRNPTTKANSTRKLAKKLGIGNKSAHRILRKDLNMKPWKYQKRQKLGAQAKLKRLQRCRAMLTRFSRRRHRNIVFSDEKLFDIQQVGLSCLPSLLLFFQVFNPQNDRIWSEEEPDTEERAIERTQKAESVMVWAAISARGKSPLVFVPQNVKINKEVYVDILERHLLPWTETIFGDDPWTFQQDGAPGHKAHMVQNWLRDNCPDFIKVDPHWRNPIGEWPPNSPDLNPLDYSVWSILEEKACAKPHSNVESLKRALKKAWKEITLETLEKIVDNFPKRLKACVDANGGHFE